jgi:hypothetical protein
VIAVNDRREWDIIRLREEEWGLYIKRCPEMEAAARELQAFNRLSMSILV